MIDKDGNAVFSWAPLTGQYYADISSKLTIIYCDNIWPSIMTISGYNIYLIIDIFQFIVYFNVIMMSV